MRPAERWWEEDVKAAILALYQAMGVPTNYDTQIEINKLLLNFSKYYPAFDASVWSLSYIASAINSKVRASPKLKTEQDREDAIKELSLNISAAFYRIINKYFKGGASLEDIDVAELIGDLDAIFKQKTLIKQDPNIAGKVFKVVQEIHAEILREMAQDIRGIIQKSEAIFAGQRIILDEKDETDEVAFYVGARIVKIISDIALEPENPRVAKLPAKATAKISDELQQYLQDQLPGIMKAKIAIEHGKLTAEGNIKRVLAGNLDPILMQALIAQLPNAPAEIQKELAKLAAVHASKVATTKETREQRSVSDYPAELRDPANLPTLVASLMYMGISYASDSDLTFSYFNSFVPEIKTAELSNMVKTLFKLQTSLGMAEDMPSSLMAASTRVDPGIKERIAKLEAAKQSSERAAIMAKTLRLQTEQKIAKSMVIDPSTPSAKHRS